MLADRRTDRQREILIAVDGGDGRRRVYDRQRVPANQRTASRRRAGYPRPRPAQHDPSLPVSNAPCELGGVVE